VFPQREAIEGIPLQCFDKCRLEKPGYWCETANLDAIEGVESDDSTTTVRHVRLTAETLCSGNNLLKLEHVQVGRAVKVIGLALENGTIQAYRMIVYVNRRPVDTFGANFVDPLTSHDRDEKP